MGRQTVHAIIFNVTLSVVSIVFLNFLSYAVIVGYSVFLTFMQQSEDPEHFQVSLPNYSQDREAAKIIFKDMDKQSHQYAAAIGWLPNTLQTKSVNINSDRNRIHKILERNTINKQSVYFFGGSTTWGMGAWDNETIPALFGSIANLPSYNMGQSGWVSRQNLARFINVLSQGTKIDIAIFYDGHNDVTVGCRVELNPQDHSNVTVFERKINKKSEIDIWESLEFLTLSQTKKLADKIRGKLLPSTVQVNLDKSLICDNSQKRARKVATTLVSNWEMAHDIAIARNIKFYAVLQPTGYFGIPKVDHLQQYYSSQHQKEIAKQIRAVYPLLKELVRERKHDWIFDYTDAFSRDEYIFIGAVHVSPNGNQIIAERLYRDIVGKQM